MANILVYTLDGKIYKYWMTRQATGSNEFPGTADYSNK